MLESLGIAPPNPLPTNAPPLLDLLPATADELVRTTGLAPGEIAAVLAELEIAQLVAEGDGIYRALASRRR